MAILALVAFTGGGVATESSAMDCVTVPQSNLSKRLEQAHFPVALLSRVGVRDVSEFGDFTECSPKSDSHATMMIYGSIDRRYPLLTDMLTFMVFEFPTAAARDKAISKGRPMDVDAAKFDTDKVVYLMSPGSRTAFRIELWHGYPLG